ncbi:FAD:protein FMN transferase [Candidatus Dojkabacteria bacterium]|nr:FAD:protein FMN transferase [Candidatus Dojkabacteria bacterium]
MIQTVTRPRIIEQERVFMNSKLNIKVFSDAERDEIEKKIDEAFSKFRYIVNRFTRFEETSELAKLNDSKKAFEASKELFRLVRFSLDVAEETDGAFDPTIIDLIEAYGYKKGYDFSVLEDPEKIRKEIDTLVKDRPNFRDIKLNEKASTITLAKNQRIDLGGIGKGYAMDLARKVLLPLKNFLINAGGDIYAHGVNKENKPWTAGLLFVDEKGKSEVIRKMNLKNQALASSGSWARKVKYFHHLLNPKTGKPCSKILQSFVVAKSAILADAYSTALFVAGRDGIKLLERKELEGMLVDKEHTIYKTKGFVN